MSSRCCRAEQAPTFCHEYRQSVFHVGFQELNSLPAQPVLGDIGIVYVNTGKVPFIISPPWEDSV